MRISMAVLREAVGQLEPYLSHIARTAGTISVEAVRGAIQQARKDGVPVGSIRSDRSCALIEEIYVEGCY